VYHRILSLFILAEGLLIRRFGLLALAGIWGLSWGCSGGDTGGAFTDDAAVMMIGDDGGVIVTPPTTCVSSKNCPIDQVCGPDKTCVQCAGNADCAMGMLCQASKCVMPSAACTNSLDCKSDPNNPICDSSTGKCVLCVASKDCPTNNDCINHACKPYVACANSLDCPQGQVCETTRMRCVECIGTNDCPTTSKCVSNACRAKCTSDTQCTSMGQLCDLGQGICVQCIGAADCKTDEFCSGGTCTPDVCTANSTSCQTNSVVTCRADGSGFGSPVSCAGQVCVATGTTAACKDHLCTPSVTACSATGEQVIKCAADGLSQTVQDDCAGKAQVCVAGQCVTGVCSPGKRYCSGNEARQCSVKGDSYTVVQSCQLTEYCEAATATCKTKVCTANMPACNGRIATVCNADGSGFMVGGTQCDPKYCNAGVCVDYLFREDFEDGDLLGWTTGLGTYTRTVTTATAAAATTHSLLLTKTASSGASNDGIYQVFGSPLAPSSISWYVRIALPYYYAGNFALYSGATATDQLVLMRFYGSGGTTGTAYMNYSTTTFTKTYSTNIWYHLELRNINWQLRTFDWYWDGVLQRAGAHFGGTGTSIGRIDLYNYYASDSAYFDQIEFLP